MDVESRIRHSLKYPFDGKDSKYKPVLLGALFVAFTPFIIPLFTLFGYQLRCYEASVEQEPRPEFTGVLGLTKEGFVAILSLIPAFLIVGVLTSIPSVLTSAGLAPGLITSLATFFLVVLSSLVTPVFLALYVDTRSFTGTYDISRFISIAKNKDYLLQMVLFSLLSGLFQIVAVFGSLFIITIPFVSVYVTIVTSSYLGDMFRPFLDQTREK